MKFCEECEDMMSESTSGNLCEHCSGSINAYRKTSKTNNKPKAAESDIKCKKKDKPRKEKQKW